MGGTECTIRYGDIIDGGYFQPTPTYYDVHEILPILYCCMKPQGQEAPSSTTVSLEARRMRRQLNLDKVEIAEDDMIVTDESLGKGEFGAVYIADYNGRNAAAKVSSC